MSTLAELAARIDAHLKRLEMDPSTNVVLKTTPRFYTARAVVAGRYVSVTYVSYQGPSSLSKAQATAYLEALDAGFAKQHYALPKDPRGLPTK